MIFAKVEAEIKQSLIDSDSDRAGLLSLIKSQILLDIKKQGLSDPTDEICQKVINSQIKKSQDLVNFLKESRQKDQSGKDHDRLNKSIQDSQSEIETLQKFLPPQLDEAELESIVESEIKSNQLQFSQANFGQFMKILTDKVAGQANPGRIAAILKNKLNDNFFNGPPGSGKTSQADVLAERSGFVNFSVGAIVREGLSQLSPEQMEVLKSGNLLESRFINNLVASQILKIEPNSDIIIDGFPRQPDQAQWLVDNYGDQVKVNFHINLSKQALTERLLNRGRDDDKIETVLTRFVAFNENQPTVNSVLENNNIPVCFIDGSGNIDQVYQLIRQAIESYK